VDKEFKRKTILHFTYVESYLKELNKTMQSIDSSLQMLVKLIDHLLRNGGLVVEGMEEGIEDLKLETSEGKRDEV